MDLTSQVVAAINAFLANASAQLLAPALSALGTLLFITPAFDQIGEVEQLWSVVRDIADALFILAIVAAGVLIMASGTFASHYTAKLLIPRLALAAVGTNLSLAVAGALIRVENAIVVGLLGGEPSAALTGQLAAMLTGPVADQLIGMLVALFAAALGLLLVVLCIGRDVVLLVLTVLAPLAFATYVLPHTEELARMWWRVFVGLLFVQAVQAVVVKVGLELLRNADWLGAPSSSLISGLLLLAVLYLVFRLPFAAYQWAFHKPLVQSAPVRTLAFAARAALPAA